MPLPDSSLCRTRLFAAPTSCTPPPLDPLMLLSSTVLSLEWSMRMPSPELEPIVLSWTSVPRVPLARMMPRSLPATTLRRSVLPVDAVVGVDQGDRRFLVLVQGERLDDVAGGARLRGARRRRSR